MECYVFNTLLEAENSLAYIDEAGGTPITGRNALTGELEPLKTKTETWAKIQQRITDNKYFFPRVSEDILSLYPLEVLKNFNDNYTFVIETFDSSWLLDTREVV